MGTQIWPHYVNRLYSAVERNINRSFIFVCFTDDAKDIRSEVDVYPLPEINLKALIYLTKLYKIGLFANNIGDLQGSCLIFDLDTVVVRSIDCYLTTYLVNFVFARSGCQKQSVLEHRSLEAGEFQYRELSHQRCP